MSEHSTGPGADELDTTFGAVVDDVASRSRPPGAEQAVRSAGRRRAVSATAAVVVVVALVVGFGGWAVQDRTSGDAPVVGVPSAATPSSPAASTDDAVPAPATMSLPGLNAASKGWARWQQGTADVQVGSACLAASTPAPQPPQESTQLYVTSGGGGVALLRQFRFASVGDSNLAMRAAVEQAEACPGGTGSFAADVSADLEVVGTSWRSGGRSGAVWLVNHGGRMDAFSVVGPPKPSDEVWQAVSELVAADVQVP